MPDDYTRRDALRGIGTAATLAVLGGGVASATPAEGRYIVDTDTVSESEMGDVEVVHDLDEEIGYKVVECGESALPSGATYLSDWEIDLERPAVTGDSELNAEDDVSDPLADLQWDKQSQDVGKVHDTATGEGARIGVLDDGVLGANPDNDFAHPDLPNVRGDLSSNFTGDGQGPGPLNDDHGTHVAGTAAAAANDTGVVGIAPDAEVVDLRVFSGQGAMTGDIAAAIVYGATPVDAGGAGCDVLNLSLGVPPLVPFEDPSTAPDAWANPGVPYIAVEPSVIEFFESAYGAAASFALDNGCLPVASAGNSGINLSAPVSSDEQAPALRFEGVDGVPSTFPAEAPGYLTVGATGPVGYGWPYGDGAEEVIPGFPLESPIQTELFVEEPALYTNYGGDAVDVTAEGGNADGDAQADGVGGWFYDLVFSTAIGNVDPTRPENVRLDEYEPSYAWKAGTSFAAPQVAGLAALLFGLDGDASPGAVRGAIERTAYDAKVGKAGQTTAPSETPNVGGDGEIDGNTPSNPGSSPQTLSPEAYRGNGHIDVRAAAREFDSGGNGDGNGNGNGKGNGNGNGKGNGDGKGNGNGKGNGRGN
jgi:hypothetical protein